MGDDLDFDVSGVKIFFRGQELKNVKEIRIPPDIEMPEQLSAGQIHAFPDEAYGKLKLKPLRRPHWRQIERAYKLMRTTAMRRICQESLSKGGHVIIKAHANTGKSAAPLEIVGYAENVEGGQNHETLLHIASLHGE